MVAGCAAVLKAVPDSGVWIVPVAAADGPTLLYCRSENILHHDFPSVFRSSAAESGAVKPLASALVGGWIDMFPAGSSVAHTPSLVMSTD